MLAGRRLLADLTPLRESAAYRRLWAGTTVSSAGSALTAFALVLQVYQLTRSSFAVGALGLASMLPTLLIGLLGGSLADLLERRRLVLATSGGLAVVSAGLTAAAWAGLRQVWLLYALAAAQAALNAVDRPARATFTASLLRPGQLPAGLALERLSNQIVLTTGPAIAGIIAAAPALGVRACYLLDTASFAAALYAVAAMPAIRPEGGLTRPGPRAVAKGMRFIRRSPLLAGAFLADLNATVFGLPVALFPAINAARFGGSPATLGLFTAAIGVGGLASAALSGPVGSVARPGRAMLAAVAVWGAAFAGFAVAPDLWLALALLAAAGAADTFTVVFRGAIVQAVTPGPLRGRVLAADYVVGAGGPQLGNVEAGALASLTSPAISALAGGLITVAGAVVIGVALPAFTRHRRDLPGPAAAAGSPAGGRSGGAGGRAGGPFGPG
jgi:MFS family permease